MSMVDAAQHKIRTKKTGGQGFATIGRLAGAVGVVFLVSAPITWFLTGTWGVLVWGKLALGVILLGVYLATNPDFLGRLAGSRSTGLLAMSAASIVVALGIVGVVNYVAYKNPKEIDFTQEGLYTLSEQTTKVLGRLADDVQIYAFFTSADPSYATAQETLRRYAQAGPKLRFEMVDPQARPDLVERFQITDRGPRLVVTARGQDARAKDVSEEELTNAIIKVAEQTSKTIYFLTGHGENDIEDGEGDDGYKSVADALTAEGYRVEKLSLTTGTGLEKGTKVTLGNTDEKKNENTEELSVPAGVSVLVIASPRSPLFAPEIAALEGYLAKGGRLVVLLEPERDGGLTSLLGQWKVQPANDLVVDTNPLNRLLGLGPAAPMVQPTETQAEHPIVKDLTSPAIFVTARSLTIGGGGLPGVDATTLLETASSSWGETNLVGGTASFDDKDRPGPLPVAVIAHKQVNEADKRSGEARVVVTGDAQWLGNKYLGVQSNRDLATNLVHWLAEEQERIAIRPKSRAASQLFLTGDQMGQIKFFALDILPVLLVATGLGIVLIRRQR